MSKKLLKATLVKNLRGKPPIAHAGEAVQDIEDVVAGPTSPFFSPLQTRQQRKRTGNPAIIRPLPGKRPPTQQRAGEQNNLEAAAGSGMQLQNLTKTEPPAVEPNSAELAQETKQVWMPKNWLAVLENIRAMRGGAIAPVDSMGCDKCADNDAEAKTQRFQKLVALMLSSQTKDETTFQAMQRLKANNLTPESISKMESSKLEELLCPVSFYKNKAKYLQKTAQLLVEKYSSDIPKNVTELISLPGVGPKMAHICMSTAWGEMTGIGVDVHVHRIANRLQWVPKPTKEPEQTRKALEAWLPRELWGDINHLLVGFGQTVCTPQRPHCGDCLNQDICPSVDRTKVAAAKKKLEITPIQEAKFQKKKMK